MMTYTDDQGHQIVMLFKHAATSFDILCILRWSIVNFTCNYNHQLKSYCELNFPNNVLYYEMISL